MPDVYARITDADEATLDVVANAMELRATDPRQQESSRPGAGGWGTPA